MLSADAREALTHLVQRYHGSLATKQADLEAACQAAEEDNWSEDAIRQLKLLVHRLAGSAASYGFNKLGEAARELDQTLSYAQENGGDDHEHSINARYATLRAAIKDAISRPPPGDPAAQAETTQRVLSDLPTVVLVDDDQAIVEVLSQQLMALGFDVHGFTDASLALNAIGDLTPAGVIMDVQFAEGEEFGFQVAEAMVSRLRYRPGTVYMSADNSMTMRQWAVDAGGDAFFSKPVNVPALAQLLELFAARRDEEAKSGRVSIVEDDEQIAQFYANLLRGSGFEVDVVHDSTRALERVLDFRPDLVLMDMQMPEFDGIQLTHILRQHETLFDIPVLFLTSETDPKKHRNALRAGGDAILQKTDDPDLLVSLVSNRITRFRRVSSSLTLDPLTRMLNRPTLMERVNFELQRAQRDGQAFCIGVLDIDNFKQFNDDRGRLSGDAVLREVADIVRGRLRRADVVGRYGGDEFMILMPSTKRSSGEAVIRSLASQIADSPITVGEGNGQSSVQVSVSVGLIESRLDRHDSAHFAVHQLLGAVDEQMATAKQTGPGTVLASVQWLEREATRQQRTAS